MSEAPQRPFLAMPYPGIFRITCPTPLSGLPHVHVYITEGTDGGLVLFDTAMNYEDSYQRILNGIEWMGRKPSDVERIYLTHAHPDHFGCSGMLQDETGAEVVCHPNAKRVLEAMANPDPERWRTRMNVYEEFGWTMPEMMTTGRPMLNPFAQMTLPKDMTTIDEGDTVTFAGGDWDVYWTPGHEEGHVVFHRRSDGVMIVGDTVLGKITPHIGWMGEPADPLAQFLDSLEKVARLEPLLVLPGHGRPFDEGAERARTIAGHHAQRLRRCLEILRRSGPLKPLDIAGRLFDRVLIDFEERLALAETLSHLEYLRLAGQITRDKIGGVWHYAAPRSVLP